jgi:hypothetical protein
LRPHLEFVELDREPVLVDAGARLTHVYLPQSAIISKAVRLSEGQSVEVALVGRDSVFGVSAALDGGIALTDAAVLLSGTASILDAAVLRAAAKRSAALRALLARHEQCLRTGLASRRLQCLAFGRSALVSLAAVRLRPDRE